MDVCLALYALRTLGAIIRKATISIIGVLASVLCMTDVDKAGLLFFFVCLFWRNFAGLTV